MVNQTHDVYNNTEMTHSHVIIYGNIWFKLGFFSYLSSLADLTDLNEWELHLQIPTAFFQILKSQGKDDAAKQTFETNLDLFEKELGERGALFGGNAKKTSFLYFIFAQQYRKAYHSIRESDLLYRPANLWQRTNSRRSKTTGNGNENRTRASSLDSCIRQKRSSWN